MFSEVPEEAHGVLLEIDVILLEEGTSGAIQGVLLEEDEDENPREHEHARRHQARRARGGEPRLRLRVEISEMGALGRPHGCDSAPGGKPSGSVAPLEMRGQAGAKRAVVTGLIWGALPL